MKPQCRAGSVAVPWVMENAETAYVPTTMGGSLIGSRGTRSGAGWREPSVGREGVEQPSLPFVTRWAGGSWRDEGPWWRYSRCLRFGKAQPITPREALARGLPVTGSFPWTDRGKVRICGSQVSGPAGGLCRPTRAASVATADGSIRCCIEEAGRHQGEPQGRLGDIRYRNRLPSAGVGMHFSYTGFPSQDFQPVSRWDLDSTT